MFNYESVEQLSAVSTRMSVFFLGKRKIYGNSRLFLLPTTDNTIRITQFARCCGAELN